MKDGDLMTEALGNVDLTVGPQIALLVFFVFMTLLCLWLVRPHAKRTYTTLSRSALDDGG